MAGVFLSYRRRTDGDSVERLVAALTRVFGSRQVLIDVEALRADEDDLAAIETALDTASVGVIVVGPAGLSDPEPPAAPAAEAEALMHAELNAALARRLPLLLVLLPGARRPQANELPAGLAALAHLPALEVRERQRTRDQRVLIETLVQLGGLARRDRSAGKSRLATPARFHWLVAGVALAVAMLVGVGYWAGLPAARPPPALVAAPR